jgi:hypothetical protein
MYAKKKLALFRATRKNNDCRKLQVVKYRRFCARAADGPTLLYTADPSIRIPSDASCKSLQKVLQSTLACSHVCSLVCGCPVRDWTCGRENCALPCAKRVL